MVIVQLLFGLTGCGIYIDDDAKSDRSHNLIEDLQISVSEEGELTTTSTVECDAIYADFTRVDDFEPPELTFAWSIDDGELFSDTQSVELAEHNIPVGSMLKCEVSFSDTLGTYSDSTDVEVGNTLPEEVVSARIQPVDDNDDFQVERLLECSATFSDHDDGESPLTYLYLWTTEDGQEVSSEQRYTVSKEDVMPGDSLICTVTGVDANDGEVSSSATVEIVNAPPEVSDVTVSLLRPGQTSIYNNDTLVCSGTIRDPEGEELEPVYQWFWGQQSLDAYSTTEELTLTPEIASPGDEITCRFSTKDSDNASAEASASVQVDNRLPEINSVNISNAQPFADDTVNCVVEATDPDMDEVDITYEWRNLSSANTVLGDQEELVLTPILVEPLDEIECMASITDGTENGEPRGGTATIQNSAPTFISPAGIFPSMAATGTTMTCSAVAADINLGDTLTTTYEWTLGTQTVSTTDMYNIPQDSVGETLTCTVSTTDGQFSAETSVMTVVQNSMPVFYGADINPSPFNNDDIVSCSATIWDIDESNFSGVPTCTWEDVNGILLSGTTDDPLDLGTTSLLPGDDLICIIEVEDANGGYAQVALIERVANRSPSEPTVTISPEIPIAGLTDVTCEGSATDVDGDSLSYAYEWTNDVGLSHLGAVLPASMLSKGEEWTCEVSVTDPMSTTPVTSSASVTVCDCDFSMDVGGHTLEMNMVTAGQNPPYSGVNVNFTLTNDYLVGTTEVTQGMYEALMGTDWRNASSPSDDGLYMGDNYPMNYVTWYMAADFANYLTELHNQTFGTSLNSCYSCTDPGTTSPGCWWTSNYDPYTCDGYRLPTEAEWELAARSGTNQLFWTGGGSALGGPHNVSDCTSPVRIMDGDQEPFLTEYAWYCKNASEPNEVGQKLPNGYGLFDMHGNVYEWTGDFDSAGLSATIDPWYGGNTYSTVKLIARGGGYSNNPNQITNYFRERSAPQTAGGSGFQNIGFRVVRIP